MTEAKPYFVPSNSSSKSNTKRQHIQQTQTNYEALLSNFSNNKPIISKQPKSQSSAFQCDKYYIQSLQQQIIELKDQVNYLLQENSRLQQQQDKSLNKIKQQYYQLTKYSAVVQMIQQLKVENLTLKQNFQSLKLDFSIQLLPLKQLFNHIISIPKTQISDIMHLTIQQQNSQLSMLKNKSEILNIERTHLLDLCYKYEEDLAASKIKDPKK